MPESRLRNASHLTLVLGAALLASVPSPARGDCSADSGTVEAVIEPGVTVTCDATDPNPFLFGIGSVSTEADLTVTIEEGASVASTTVGVTLADNGALTNGGTVIATDEAVLSITGAATERTTITNDGRLESTGGVAVNTGRGNADITNTGAIVGVTGGVSMSGSRLDNSGSIDATDANAVALDAGASSSVDNTGSIVSAGSGVVLGAGSTLDNSGVLTSQNGTGVTAGSDALVTNTGDIDATAGAGVELQSGATLDNAGRIDASGAAAVTVASGADLTNTGTLASATGAAVIASGGASIDNGGSIQGTGGEAVRLTGDDNTLTLRSGSSLQGSAVAVSSGAATDDLILLDSGSEDDDFLNFASLTLSGGTWSLAGTVQARDVAIDSGTLTINGTLDTRDSGGSATSIVLNAGALSGTGTVFASLDNVAGTVSAGDPAGTLTIDGDYRQASTATMRVTGSSSDIGRLQVNGSADLAGTLVVSAGSDVVSDILVADGGIDGFYDNVQVDGRALVAVVPSPNSIRLVRTSTTLEDNMVEANLDNTYLVLDALAPPLPEARSGVWVRGIGYYGDRNETDGLPGGDYWIGGALIGGDWQASDRWRIGGAAGYTSTNLDSDDDSHGDSDNWNYGIYALYDSGRLWGSLAFAGSSGDYDQHRRIVVNGAREDVPASYDSTAYAVRGSFGIRADLLGDLAGRWVFEPMVSVDYVVTDLDDYQDTGGSGLDYQIGDIESLQLSGLLRLRQLSTPNANVAPRLHAGVVYRKALDDREWQAQSPGGGLSLVLPGDDDDETLGVAAAGFEVRFGHRTTLHADVVGEFSDDKDSYALLAGLRVEL